MKAGTKHLKSLGWLGMLLGSMFLVASVAAAVEVGELAPDFTLRSTTGGKISLSQFRGKQSVLLEFYSADFIPA